MFRNRFANSRGPSSYGILLKEISGSIVAANTFEKNTTGILMDGTTRTQFEGNILEGNGWAVRAFGDTDSNHFTRNDFIGNTFDVTTNASANQNDFTENYWSRYQGLDLDKDGYGDEPFQFVSLSSLLMEQYGISILLIDSTFFSILDQIENILPVLTPQTFRDRRPRMTRAGQL
jgi:nitrous oxidase accessory protein